jgi:hypothetical protein
VCRAAAKTGLDVGVEVRFGDAVEEILAAAKI